MSQPKLYDPGQIVIVFGPVLIQGGFAPDSFVKIARAEKSFSSKPGADGEVTRVRSRVKMGSFTFTLQATSGANALLNALVLADEASPSGVSIFPCSVKDLLGVDLAVGSQSWLAGYADREYAKDVTVREWQVDTDNLQFLF